MSNNQDDSQNKAKTQTLPEYLDELSEDIFRHHEETVVFVIYSVLAFIIQAFFVLIMQKNLGMVLRRAYLSLLKKYEDEMTPYCMQGMLEDEAKITQDPIRFAHLFPFISMSFFLGIFWIFAVYRNNRIARYFLWFFTVFFILSYLLVLGSWMTQSESISKLLMNAIVNNQRVVLYKQSWLYQLMTHARDILV